MIISNRKRIRNLINYFAPVPLGSRIIIGLSNIERFNRKLNQIGFNSNSNVGESHLPPPIFGTISDYNANGRYNILRDLPMETCYRTVIWKWKQWNGRYDTTEQSRYVDVPYLRFQREFIFPPSVELSLQNNTNGESMITTHPIDYISDNFNFIKHIINLFLEIFNECEIFTDNLNRIIQAPIVRLNWDILPKGKIPWDRLQKKVNPIIDQAPEGNRVFIRNRIETINNYNPSFYAVGRGGFNGYIIFGFNLLNLYVLESIHHGNATYVFENNWRSLSQMTKAEILNQNLHRQRIIHRSNWFVDIKALFGN